MKKLLVFFSLALLLSFDTANAATPTMFLTWKADTYTPSGYPGKALTTPGSNVIFSVEVFQDGKILSLKNNVIRWYVQGHLYKGGLGLQSFSAPAKVLSGNDLRVRVEIPDLPGGALSKTILLRVTDPKIVIEAPFPNLITPIKDFFVKATPYFFSVPSEKNLSYRWTVNGSVLEEGADPQLISITARSIRQSTIRTLSFKISAKNPNEEFDQAEAIKTVTIKETP